MWHETLCDLCKKMKNVVEAEVGIDPDEDVLIDKFVLLVNLIGMSFS